MLQDEEYFGSPEHVAMSRRAEALAALLEGNPRFSFYGRIVALNDPREDAAEVVSMLARCQGAGVAYYLPKTDAAAFFAAAEAGGLATDRHEHYRGGVESVPAARGILAAHPLPADLDVVRLGPDTPRETLRDVAALMQASGVMPVPGHVLRGLAQPGLCLAAVDRSGAPVACAASYALHPRNSPRAGDVFWGMLTTDPARRGEKIALILGAMAMVHMAESYGATGFMTGVRADNAASQALCAKVGVVDTDWIYANVIDRTQLSGAVTK